MPKLKKCISGTLIYTFALLLLLFLVIFVIIPVVFKYSVEIQRNIIFPTWYAASENYLNVEGLQGVRNFYVTVDEKENITLGTWQILPIQLLSSLVNNEHYDYESQLKNDQYPVIIYLHGNGGVRSIPLELYSILRKYFQILAPDYRGYADSTKAELTEDNIVSDIVNFYKWIKRKTRAKIFFWGHSLGTGVSTHVISDLKAQDFVPSGLVLEAPFSSVPDVMEHHYFLRLLSWLPWYKTTMLDPVIENGFGFESTKYISDVDCPIMILHAKDDTIVPYELATKLYETAIKNRNVTLQGNVTLHLFEERGYGHMFLYSVPELPKLVMNFVEECVNFDNNKNHTLEG